MKLPKIEDKLYAAVGANYCGYGIAALTTANQQIKVFYHDEKPSDSSKGIAEWAGLAAAMSGGLLGALATTKLEKKDKNKFDACLLGISAVSCGMDIYQSRKLGMDRKQATLDFCLNAGFSVIAAKRMMSKK